MAGSIGYHPYAAPWVHIPMGTLHTEKRNQGRHCHSQGLA
uniref:Uncharacterized protein n=1 Tax=Anguilla anguilla TaxID=7936 RepID=A0A0E9SZ67_ANGAN